jgi:flagellar biosynthesis protein FlhA
MPAVWIPKTRAEEARLAGYMVVDNLNTMVTHLTEVLRKHAWELLGRQEVQNLLDNLSRDNPKAVEELVPDLLPLGSVQTVLQNLLRENVPIKDMLTIVEALADCAPRTKDADMLTEFVRWKLARSIVSPHIGEDGVLMVITMGQNAEDTLSKDLQTAEYGSMLPADPRVVERLVAAIRDEADRAEEQSIQPILLTSQFVLRKHLWKWTEYAVPSLMVISQMELPDETRIKSIGEVDL